mmetsp:Transcript_22146/g.27168  ORF Transcript_22146/g.27168 Transcript_22146/m.27168 type:complete len:423 (+) Transcript_22146:188-1456(+)
MHQRKGNLDCSTLLQEKSLHCKKDKDSFTMTRMLNFLNAATCDWSHQSIWQPNVLSIQKSNESRGGRFDLALAINRTYKINIGYVYSDTELPSAILKIPHMHDPSTFHINHYMIKSFQISGIAEQIYKDGIEILVLLHESPFHVFDEIFGRRPAPIQISFTPFAMEEIDYFIMSATEIPKEFPTKHIQVPGIFVDADKCKISSFDKQDVADLRPLCGISEDAFVYASFSQPFEIDKAIFNTWLNILKGASESSILLLLRHNLNMEYNLKKEAESKGIAPKRIVFLDSFILEQHANIYSLIDLYLETSSNFCNQSSLFEALVSGTPAICLEEGNSLYSSSFGSRVLSAVGLKDQVVSSLAEYENLAVRLQFDEDKFIDIVRRLDDKRFSDQGLIDPVEPLNWMNNYENALNLVYKRFQEVRMD